MYGMTPHIGQTYTALIVAIDEAFMRLYDSAHRNRRRMARLALALFPMVLLLVGSCKGVSTTGATTQMKLTAAEQLRSALFPQDTQGDKRPAAGYISAAKSYVADTPDTLTLLTDREIGYLFGTPAMTRKDAEARVIQYRGGPCVVDFYFYENTEGTAPVSHVDVRSRSGNTEKASCVSDVIRHKRIDSDA